MQRSNWRPSRIWLNMSPEFEDITSQDRLGRIPCSSARRITGWPMPIWISVSGLDETLQPLSASRSKSRSSSVLQCTCTCSGPEQAVVVELRDPLGDRRAPDAAGVEHRRHAQLARRARPRRSSARRAAAPTSVSATPIVTSPSSPGSSLLADPARVGEPLARARRTPARRGRRVVAVARTARGCRRRGAPAARRRRAPACCCSARSRGSW